MVQLRQALMPTPELLLLLSSTALQSMALVVKGSISQHMFLYPTVNIMLVNLWILLLNGSVLTCNGLKIFYNS